MVHFRNTPMHYLTAVGKNVLRDGALPICWPLLSCIIHTLFAYFLACHPYISNVFFIFFLFSSLTAVPSENQCLSSGAYEWPVLVSLKHAVGLSQHCFLLQEWLSKLMACSPNCELHSRHLGCGLELILAVYREVHAHSFVLKCLLQWHVHAQHY